MNFIVKTLVTLTFSRSATLPTKRRCGAAMCGDSLGSNAYPVFIKAGRHRHMKISPVDLLASMSSFRTEHGG